MVVALLYTALAARPVSAAGKFRVCNKTSEVVSLAIAYYYRGGEEFLGQPYLSFPPRGGGCPEARAVCKRLSQYPRGSAPVLLCGEQVGEMDQSDRSSRLH